MEVDGEFITKELEGIEINVEPVEAIGVEEIFTWKEPQDLTINDEPEEVALTPLREWSRWHSS